jgi:16S rRNA processing protein RimM
VTVQVRTDDPERASRPGASAHRPAERGPASPSQAPAGQNGRLVLALEGVQDRTGAELLRETPAAGRRPARCRRPRTRTSSTTTCCVAWTAAPRRRLARSARSPTCSTCRTATCWSSAALTPAARCSCPFVKAMVPVVDVAARRLQVDPPEGLLDVDAPR